MKNLTADELREMYLKFFESKGHKIIPGASVIPENDPTVLFTTAGMHPLVPYLMGAMEHPAGTRLTDVQKCVRTGDIDAVGDSAHLTFFEMLGNWSLNDYFKKEAISWSYEFLTTKLGFSPDQLSVTVFKGEGVEGEPGYIPADEEAVEIWKSLGIPDERIYRLPREDNWWGPAGTTGPCGPDTEMFIDMGGEKCCETCSPACDCGKYLEIWNNVFMSYYKQEDGTYTTLKQRNVDTGMGLERTLCILNGQKSVYDTELFSEAKAKIEELTGTTYGQSEEITRAYRIILDHVRTATFLIGDARGIVPSNVDQGYVLRRLIRRAVRFGRNINLPEGSLAKIATCYVEKYKNAYPELLANQDKIILELNKEEEKFSKTLTDGLKEFNKVVTYIKGEVFPGKTAFRLYDTFGFPLEITEELAKEKGFTVDVEGYNKAFEEHQKKSSQGSEQKFKGGLADTGEQTARLHTATHLMQAALKKVLDPSVGQKGSNITVERLRFDFNFDRPMTAEEIAKVEELVNEAIKADVEITCQEMSVEEAKSAGAVGLFESRYGEVVKVYTMGEFSKEICGGPHANRTGELGTFKIVKEQSSSAGVRRIKAILS